MKYEIQITTKDGTPSTWSRTFPTREEAEKAATMLAFSDANGNTFEVFEVQK